MIFTNGNIELQTRKIKLPRGFEFIVAAMPFGWQVPFSELWPEPAVPKKVTRGVGGKESVQYLTDDPRYTTEKMQRDLCLAAYRFRLILKHDPNIQWETPELTTRDALVALGEEFKNCGLTAQELMLLTDASNHLAGDHVDEQGQEKDVSELFV